MKEDEHKTFEKIETALEESQAKLDACLGLAGLTYRRQQLVEHRAIIQHLAEVKAGAKLDPSEESRKIDNLCAQIKGLDANAENLLIAIEKYLQHVKDKKDGESWPSFLNEM